MLRVWAREGQRSGGDILKPGSRSQQGRSHADTGETVPLKIRGMLAGWESAPENQAGGEQVSWQCTCFGTKAKPSHTCRQGIRAG